MRNQRYKNWDELRRKRFPEATHTARESEQADGSAGFIRVAYFSDIGSWVLSNPVEPEGNSILGSFEA